MSPAYTVAVTRGFTDVCRHRDTQTAADDWRRDRGWIDIDVVRRMPIVQECLLAGRLSIRELGDSE